MKTRRHIKKGLLVYSTNPIKQACIRVLTIVQVSDALTSRRIKREVICT